MPMVLIANAAAVQIQARKVPTAQIFLKTAIGVPNGNKAANGIPRRNVNQQGTNQSNAETISRPSRIVFDICTAESNEKSLMARFLLKESGQDTCPLTGSW
jgi:hypothetical protein